MSLEKKISTEMIQAMKDKNALKVSTLRMLKSVITNLAIQNGKKGVEDAEVMTIIQKQIKQRQDSYDSFAKAGRDELAQKEKDEIAILETYLPQQLGDDELTELIKEAIKETGSTAKADMGKVMKAIMRKVQGRADGKRINSIVGPLLS